mmetsp:Transcript_3275/g.3238  ORF Transcript_3275/g.3238 Transcript_3275/m.3238 type:complete len:222 (+) Transcript_3275:17-682(+)
MPDYGNPSYWDERYAANDEPFDWYQDYSTLKDYLSKIISPSLSQEILIPGCGSSRLGPDLYDAGYTNITHIDTSMIVINQMNDRYFDREEMEFTFMDATNMEHIPDDCFDIVLDKALLDTLLCSENNLQKVEDYLFEIYRVLKSTGIFIIISHGLPLSRLDYFDQDKWTIEPISIPKPPVRARLETTELSQDHYMYVCKKNLNKPVNNNNNNNSNNNNGNN